MKTLSEIRAVRGGISRKNLVSLKKSLEEIIKVTKRGDADYFDDDLDKIRDIAERLLKAAK